MNSAAVRASLSMRLVVIFFAAPRIQIYNCVMIIPWCDDTLNGWIVCQIKEQAHILHTSILLKILLEEPVIYECNAIIGINIDTLPGSLHVDTHSGKDDGKVVIVVVKDTFAW